MFNWLTKRRRDVEDDESWVNNFKLQLNQQRCQTSMAFIVWGNKTGDVFVSD